MRVDRGGRVKCDVMARLVLALHVIGGSKVFGDRIVERVQYGIFWLFKQMQYM